jgi:hypothetical protein
MDARAARLRVFVVFQHQHAAAGADDEPVAIRVVGREARSGVSLKCVDSAPIASNWQVMPQCSSSPPPAKTMSCAPRRIRSAAAPMQCAEVAQAADNE